jgi:hypothetical protein
MIFVHYVLVVVTNDTVVACEGFVVVAVYMYDVAYVVALKNPFPKMFF